MERRFCFHAVNPGQTFVEINLDLLDNLFRFPHQLRKAKELLNSYEYRFPSEEKSNLRHHYQPLQPVVLVQIVNF
jgi:hypothetical protein